MKLLVRNIARSITEADLRTLFEMHGVVQSCNIVLDDQTGESKGFGFVQMPKSGEAKAAMKELNGTELDDSKLRVKKAELPKQKR
ncbi:MAG: RNA-binding protein [Porticoccaceae bacterium]|jgi:RNA recognition motif-containing protein|nr:RNA-binding protein [Porticoccaceae bacterium]